MIIPVDYIYVGVIKDKIYVMNIFQVKYFNATGKIPANAICVSR